MFKYFTNVDFIVLVFGGLGGFGTLNSLGGNNFNNILLKRNCEGKGCCWDSRAALLSPSAGCFAKSMYKECTSLFENLAFLAFLLH